MPDPNEVQVEKISLNQEDFSEDLNSNSFGIQDTQVLASKDLQSFLLSDPDEVKNVEEEAKKAKELEDAKKQQQSQETEQEKKNREFREKKEKENEKPDGKKALENFLFKSEEENSNNSDSNANSEQDEEGKSKLPATGKTIDEPLDNATFTTLGKDLLRLGVFSKNSEEETEENIAIKSPEEFLERFNLEKKKGAIGILDNFLSQFGEDYRKMFDAIFVNGVKPDEYLHSFTRIESIKDLDLTQESNQERVVKAYYKDLKWDDTKIENRISKLRDYGDLEDEAKTYHEVLLNREKEAALNMEKIKADENQKTKEKDAEVLKSFKRILAEKLKTQEVDGIPLTQKDAEEVTDYLTAKKYKLPSGELLSEFDKDLLELNRPENHETKIKLGLLLRKKLDLSSVKKTTISKKSDALFTLSTKNAKEKSKEKEVTSFFNR